MYFLLEYFKTMAFMWMFLEGFVLHNQLVLTVFKSDPSIKPYAFAGYGISAIIFFISVIQGFLLSIHCFGWQ